MKLDAIMPTMSYHESFNYWDGSRYKIRDEPSGESERREQKMPNN